MKRVAIVTRQVEKSTGASRNTHEQVRLFRRLGWQVDVFAEFIDKAEVIKSGGEPHRVFCWPLKGYRRRQWFAWRVEKRIRKSQFNLVLGHGDIFEQHLLFLHNCVHRAHELIHGQSLPSNHDVGRIHQNLLAGGRFNLLVANSELMASDVAQRFQIPRQKLKVIHPGFDPDQFKRNERAQFRQATRQELKVNDNEVLIGLITSGNFKKRNVSLFIEAIAALPADVLSNCRFLVVGKEASVDQYLEKAHALGIGSRLTFLQPRSDIQRYFHAVDVSVLPAKWEEFGRVVLEAMACGQPVVVSDQVGCSELLEGPSREFIFPSGNSGALTSLLMRLVQNFQLREQLAELNHHTAMKYTEQKQAEKLEQLLMSSGLLT